VKFGIKYQRACQNSLLIQTACDISWGHVKGLNSSSQCVQYSPCSGVMSLLYTQICDKDVGLVLKFVFRKESVAIPEFQVLGFANLSLSLSKACCTSSGFVEVSLCKEPSC
jgi:hypothetical protein